LFVRFYPCAIALALLLSSQSAPARTRAPIPLPSLDGHRRVEKIIRRTQLSFAPSLSAEERLADLSLKAHEALRLIGSDDLKALRRRALKDAGGRYAWERLRRRTRRSGAPATVMLTIRVWAPANATRLTTFSGTEAQYNAARRRYRNLPRRSGSVLFSARIADVNDKQRYRPTTVSFETYAWHAPIAFLLLDHAFREGVYEPKKRLPIMAVRSGEDCYSADRSGGPVDAEAVSFPRRGSKQHQVTRGRYRSPGEFLQACHVRRSNHRIGCALDVNYFWLYRSRGGATNAITSSKVHTDRRLMHSVDARNLPDWFYSAAKSIGYRVPRDWSYAGDTDWPHVDLGR
jgi:hypothetical protein